MPRKYLPGKKRKIKDVDETLINEALSKVEAGTSIRTAAKEASVDEKTLRNRMKKGAPLKSGGHLSLPVDSEKELALMLCIKAKWGFALTREQVYDLVQQYVRANKHSDTDLGKYIRAHCRFKVRSNKNRGIYYITFLKKSFYSHVLIVIGQLYISQY